MKKLKDAQKCYKTSQNIEVVLTANTTTNKQTDSEK